MKGLMREFRLLPAVMFAARACSRSRSFGLVFDGGYTLLDLGFNSDPGTRAARCKPTERAAADDAGGLSPTAQSAAPPRDTLPQRRHHRIGRWPPRRARKARRQGGEGRPRRSRRRSPDPDGTVVPLDGPPPLSPGERAVLERLQERRQELEARARELDIRESLLKTAEKRLESRVERAEGRAKSASTAAMHQKDEAERRSSRASSPCTRT